MNRYHIILTDEMGIKKKVPVARLDIRFYLTKDQAIELVTDYLMKYPEARIEDITQTRLIEILRKQLKQMGLHGRHGFNGEGALLGPMTESWHLLEQRVRQWIDKRIEYVW